MLILTRCETNYKTCSVRSSENMCSSSGGAQEKGKTGWNSVTTKIDGFLSFILCWMLIYLFAGFFFLSPSVWRNCFDAVFSYFTENSNVCQFDFFIEIWQLWTFFSFLKIALSFFGLQSDENPSKWLSEFSPNIPISPSISYLAVLEVK